MASADSKYYHPEEFCGILDDHTCHTSVMYANSRSLPKHINDYKLLLDYIHDKCGFSFDIMCFVETWLNEHNESLINFDGFVHLYKK